MATNSMQAVTPTKRPPNVSFDAFIGTLEAMQGISAEDKEKLTEWYDTTPYDQNQSQLPKTEDEFANMVNLENKEIAYGFYKVVLCDDTNKPLKRQRAGMQYTMSTPVAAAGIPQVTGRQYSVLGADTPPHELLDHELTRIVTETNKLTGPLDGTEPAPFVSLLQSTGYGKTRAVIQLAETKRRMVYLPWKSGEGEEWQMPEVLCAMKELLEDAKTENRLLLLWNKFLCAVELCAAPDNYKSHQDLFLAHKNGEFYAHLKNNLNSVMSPTSALKFGNSNSTLSSLPQHVKLPKQDAGGTYYYKEAPKPTEDSLVVCLDEVTGLSDGVYRAYRRVAKQRGLLSIFADTATSICKIVPWNDQSSTQNSGKMGHFAVPLFALETIDNDLLDRDRLALLDDDYASLFFAGRPRWKSHFERRSEILDSDEKIEDLLHLASNLLTFQKAEEDSEDLKALTMLDSPKEGGPRCVDTRLIAVFACRFSLGRSSRIAPLLVKHSLATVIGVSDDRSTVYTSYPSEPILAEVSARYTKDEDNRRAVLAQVNAAFNNRTKLLDAPRGDVGEMCAAALLGFLMDTIRVTKAQKYMSEPVPLLDLLQYFGITKELHSLVHNWEINFTHFTRPHHVPTEHHLQVMWKRRLAYYVPDGCAGLDLLIAIKNKKCGTYGTLRVQVKNHKSKITAGAGNKILDKLLPKKCPPAVPDEKLSVGLLLCAGDVEACCNIVRYDDGKAFARESSRTKKPSSTQKLLQLSAGFPSNHHDDSVKELAKTLEEICRSQRTEEDFASKRFAKYYEAQPAAAPMDPASSSSEDDSSVESETNMMPKSFNDLPSDDSVSLDSDDDDDDDDDHVVNDDASSSSAPSSSSDEESTHSRADEESRPDSYSRNSHHDNGGREDIPLSERIEAQRQTGGMSEMRKAARFKKSEALRIAKEKIRTNVIAKNNKKKNQSTKRRNNPDAGDSFFDSPNDDDNRDAPEQAVSSSTSSQPMMEQESTMKQKKRSKHKPTEASSKRSDFFANHFDLNASGINVDVGAHKYKPRDPRMQSLSGHLDVNVFERRYEFLDKMQEDEIARLKQQIAARNISGKRGQRKRQKLGISGTELEEDKERLSQLTQERKERHKSQITRGAKQTVKKKLREDVADGKHGAFYLKRSEMKRLEMEARFGELKKRGGDAAVDKAVEKRRKKNLSRESKYMPPKL